MKKLFTILLILCFGFSFGQPIVARSNGSLTVQDTNEWPLSSLFIPHFQDTTAANLAKVLDSAGKIIWTNQPANTIWQRCVNPKRWVAISNGLGAINIYNSDGTLTGDRLVTMGSHSLSMISDSSWFYLNSYGVSGMQQEYDNFSKDDWVFLERGVDVFSDTHIKLDSKIITMPTLLSGNAGSFIGMDNNKQLYYSDSLIQSFLQHFTISQKNVGVQGGSANFYYNAGMAVDLTAIGVGGNRSVYNFNSSRNFMQTSFVTTDSTQSYLLTEADTLTYHLRLEGSHNNHSQAYLDMVKNGTTNNLTMAWNPYKDSISTRSTRITLDANGTDILTPFFNLYADNNSYFEFAKDFFQLYTRNLVGVPKHAYMQGTSEDTVSSVSMYTNYNSDIMSIDIENDPITKFIAIDPGPGSLLIANLHHSNSTALVQLVQDSITKQTFHIPISGGGGSGNTNSNIGTGYRWAQVFTNNIKTFFIDYGGSLDSSSHSSGITLKIDTTINGLTTKKDFYRILDSALANSPFYDFPVRNGLTVIDGGINVDTLLWGGTLAQNTSISGSNLYGVLFDSMSYFKVKGIPTSVDTTTYKVWGINPTTGATVHLPWLASGSGSTSPAGSNTQIQYNNSGSFGASADFTWDNSAKSLTANGSIYLPNSTTTKAAIYLNSVSFFSNYGVNHDNVSIFGGSLNPNNYNALNVSIGSGAGSALNAGQNIAIGYKALNVFKTADSTSAPKNIAIGDNAMGHSLSFASGQSVRDDIAIGPNTMDSIVHGFSNIAIGKITLNRLDSGTANTAIGASINLIHGGYNTIMGTDIGVNGFRGDNNSLYGSYAMQSAVNITENVAIGFSAGTSNTNGGYNTYVGPRAGYYELGSDNVMIGNYSGVNLSDHTLSNILFIGSETTGNATILGDMSTRRVGINFIDPTAIAYTLHVGGTFGVNTMPLGWDTAATKIVTWNTSTHQFGQTNWNNSASGGSGVTTMAAIGSSPNANGASISSVTLTLQPASGSFGGVVTTGTQSFAGSKTFLASPSAPTGTNGERFGLGAIGSGVGGLAVGYNADAGNDDYNSVLGTASSIVSGKFHSTAVGANNIINASNQVAIGYNISTNSGYAGSVQIGTGQTNTIGQIGIGSTLTGGFINIGSGNNYGTNATSWMIGNGLTATDQNQLLIGNTDNGWAPNNVYIGQGVTHANASTYAFLNIHATGGSGTNDIGADLALYAGQGTGSAAGGKFSIYTTPTGSSGASLNNAVERLRIAADGTISLLTTPATSASTYDVLSRNTSTGIVEKVTSATFIKQGSNTLSTNFTLAGASTYSVSLSSIASLTVTSASGNLISGTTNGITSTTGATAFTGGMIYNYAAVTATYSILVTDYIVNCTSGTFTTSLPTAVGRQGQVFIIKNSGAGIITVATVSAQTIDGSSTSTLTTLQSLRVSSDGANWIAL